MPSESERRGRRRRRRQTLLVLRPGQESPIGLGHLIAQQAAGRAVENNSAVRTRTTLIHHTGNEQHRIMSTRDISRETPSRSLDTSSENTAMQDGADSEQQERQEKGTEEPSYSRDPRMQQDMANLPAPPPRPPTHGPGTCPDSDKNGRPREEYSSKREAEELSTPGKGWNPFASSGPPKEEQTTRANKSLVKENNDLKRRNETLCQAKSLLSAKTTRQEYEIASLTEHVTHYAEAQRELEGQILIAQAAMSREAARPRKGLAEEERTIKGNFINLQNEVRKWARTWGNVPFSTITSLRDQQAQNFREQLSRVVAFQDGRIPKALESEEMSTRSSILCVSALLARNICLQVMDDPFRALRALANPNDKGSRLMSENDDTLQDVYNKLSLCNKSKAQIWRSDLLTILDPPPSDGVSEQTLQAEHEAASRRTSAAKDLSSAFQDGNVAILLRSVQPKDVITRGEQLQSIYLLALEMAGRLWKQLTVVRCSYLDELENNHFTCESDIMEAHTFHKLGLDDENEHRLDGHSIRILVFPAVKGFGNSDGANYSQERVWGKAIVWLDE